VFGDELEQDEGGIGDRTRVVDHPVEPDGLGVGLDWTLRQ